MKGIGRTSRERKEVNRTQTRGKEIKELMVCLCVDLRGGGEDLFLWWQLMSVQIENHLLLAEVQQEADSIS